MSTQLETSIGRIRTHDGIVVGAGFLVTEKLVLTCAHVVAQALGIPHDTPTIPTDKIFLDFPLVAPNKILTANVSKWLPVQPDGSGDIACLELFSNPLKEARPALLITEDTLWGHPFRAFGFPAGYDNGVWASGVLRAKQADGWVQIEDIKQTGYFIEPGFSGPAIWDEEVNGVVGMTVVAERRREVKAAFMIPTSYVFKAFPELNPNTVRICPYRGLFAFREQDAEFFFGRELFTEKLAEAVQTTPIVTVIGPSGSGKSSVVFAGLVPRLRKQGNWLITSFSPGVNPFQNLADALEDLRKELQRSSETIEVTGLQKSDGTMLVSGSWDMTIRCWDIRDITKPKSIATLRGHTAPLYDVTFSPDGKLLASGSWDMTIRLWDIESVYAKAKLYFYFSSVSSINFSPDGKMLASGIRFDKIIKIWDISGDKESKMLEGHAGYAASVNFSPDGALLASGSEDHTIKLWDVKTGKDVKTLQGHSNGLRSVYFSPDGTILASGSADNTIKLWSISDAQEINTLSGHSLPVESVCFSPNGKLLASGSRDRTVKLWNVTTGKEINTLYWHSNVVSSVTFSPDGKLLASGSLDRCIKFWKVSEISNMDLDGLLRRGCEWLQGYLKNNPNVSDEDRALCDDILENHKD